MITSLGHNACENWDRMLKAETGTDRITLFDPEGYESQVAGEVKDFDATKYMDRKEARRADRFTQFAFVAAQGADKKLISGVSVFDVFEGAAIGEGRKSIAIEVAIQPVERTLTDEDFEALAARIVENVGRQTGGVLRG